MAAGLPGRLMTRQGPRWAAIWRDRIAVGTSFRLSLAHQFAKARQHAGRSGLCRLGGQIARGGTGAARRQDQVAAGGVGEIDQFVAHRFEAIGDHPRQDLEGARQDPRSR